MSAPESTHPCENVSSADRQNAPVPATVEWLFKEWVSLAAGDLSEYSTAMRGDLYDLLQRALVVSADLGLSWFHSHEFAPSWMMEMLTGCEDCGGMGTTLATHSRPDGSTWSVGVLCDTCEGVPRPTDDPLWVQVCHCGRGGCPYCTEAPNTIDGRVL